MRPACRASAVERKETGKPRSRMLPPSVPNAPVKIFTRVLLPAPLAPIRAWISPARTLRSAERRATTGPNRLATARASRMAPLAVGSAGLDFIGARDAGSEPAPPFDLGRALAGDQVGLRVSRVRLDVERDAVVGVQARVVRRRKLGNAGCGCVVPDLRRQEDLVGVGLALGERGQTHGETRPADRRRVGHRST